MEKLPLNRRRNISFIVPIGRKEKFGAITGLAEKKLLNNMHNIYDTDPVTQ